MNKNDMLREIVQEFKQTGRSLVHTDLAETLAPAGRFAATIEVGGENYEVHVVDVHDYFGVPVMRSAKVKRLWS